MPDITLDAKGKPLGRLASEVALLLQDKNIPQYRAHKPGTNRVVVKNIHLVKVTGAKAVQKIYRRHSGRPGHLKEEKYEDLFAKYPERVLINAVRGMLPRNKLRKERLKRLVVEKTDG